jgi:hypothetical protein
MYMELMQSCGIKEGRCKVDMETISWPTNILRERECWAKPGRKPFQALEKAHLTIDLNGGYPSPHGIPA